jgi:nicotinamidase/pyrazinamidase
VGLATDYCVRATALDAQRAGFQTYVVTEGIRAVGGEEASKVVAEEFKTEGVNLITLQDAIVLGTL